MNTASWKNTVAGTVLKRALRVISIFMILGIVMHLVIKNQKIHWQDAGFASMSTFVKHRIYVYDPESAVPAIITIQEAFRKMNKLCNRFDPESELSRLNRSAYREPFACSPELWALLMKAKEMYELTDGAFDITIQPLMQHWRANRTTLVLPSAELMKKVGMDKVVFDENARTVRFTVDGMSFDLGGIAKGAALDLAKSMLDGKVAVGGKWSSDVSWMTYLDAKFRNTASPMNRGFIDVGGNVLALEKAPPNQNAYRVGVRNPLNPAGKPVAQTEILDESISTSGNYERYVTINGKQYTHIIDPRTGMPVENVLSVTVIARRAVDADALSTALFVRGHAILEKLEKRFPDLRVFMIYRDENGKICCNSTGTWENVELPK